MPSVAHETRVAMLEALARLSGHSDPFPLPSPSLGYPDVARINRRSLDLFFGDGKATESPGNSATLGRLAKYSDFLVRWHRETGASIVLAIGFSRPQDAQGWWEAVRRLSLAELDAKTTLNALDHDERVLALALRRVAAGAARLPTRVFTEMAFFEGRRS